MRNHHFPWQRLGTTTLSGSFTEIGPQSCLIFLNVNFQKTFGLIHLRLDVLVPQVKPHCHHCVTLIDQGSIDLNMYVQGLTIIFSFYKEIIGSDRSIAKSSVWKFDFYIYKYYRVENIVEKC